MRKKSATHLQPKIKIVYIYMYICVCECVFKGLYIHILDYDFKKVIMISVFIVLKVIMISVFIVLYSMRNNKILMSLDK